MFGINLGYYNSAFSNANFRMKIIFNKIKRAYPDQKHSIPLIIQIHIKRKWNRHARSVFWTKVGYSLKKEKVSKKFPGLSRPNYARVLQFEVRNPNEEISNTWVKLT